MTGVLLDVDNDPRSPPRGPQPCDKEEPACRATTAPGGPHPLRQKRPQPTSNSGDSFASMLESEPSTFPVCSLLEELLSSSDLFRIAAKLPGRPYPQLARR